MTRSKRIRPVVDIAKNRERDAAQKLGVSRQTVADQEKRLQELLQYRDEYNKRLTNNASNCMDARKLHEYQIFLSRLNQAIEQQRGVLNQALAACDEKNEHWIKKRSHAKAIHKVETRYRKQELKEQDKKEQNEMDEHAARSYLMSHEE